MTVGFMTHQGRLCLTAKIFSLQVVLALLAINTPKLCWSGINPIKLLSIPEMS
jgi:hypothetical protein